MNTSDTLMNEASVKIEELRSDKVRLRTILSRLIQSAGVLKHHGKDTDNEDRDLCTDIAEAREILKRTA